jgi:hypothetical protein
MRIQLLQKMRRRKRRIVTVAVMIATARMMVMAMVRTQFIDNITKVTIRVQMTSYVNGLGMPYVNISFYISPAIWHQKTISKV